MKPLASTWEFAIASSHYMAPFMESLSTTQRDAILESVQIYLSGYSGGANDAEFAGDRDLKGYAKLGTAQMILAWCNHSKDNPAGTGSLSSTSIGGVSVSNTMAYNNAEWTAWLKGNIYGKAYFSMIDSVTLPVAFV